MAQTIFTQPHNLSFDDGWYTQSTIPRGGVLKYKFSNNCRALTTNNNFFSYYILLQLCISSSKRITFLFEPQVCDNIPLGCGWLPSGSCRECRSVPPPPFPIYFDRDEDILHYFLIKTNLSIDIVSTADA